MQYVLDEMQLVYVEVEILYYIQLDIIICMHNIQKKRKQTLQSSTFPGFALAKK